MMRTKTHVLHGDWRRTTGTKTVAHLFAERKDRAPLFSDQLPECGKQIPRRRTSAVAMGVPCSDCLVAAIRKAGR